MVNRDIVKRKDKGQMIKAFLEELYRIDRDYDVAYCNYSLSIFPVSSNTRIKLLCTHQWTIIIFSNSLHYFIGAYFATTCRQPWTLLYIVRHISRGALNQPAAETVMLVPLKTLATSSLCETLITIFTVGRRCEVIHTCCGTSRTHCLAVVTNRPLSIHHNRVSEFKFCIARHNA